MTQGFNRMCISAACDLLPHVIKTNAGFDRLLIEWGIDDDVCANSLEKKAVELQSFATKNPEKTVATIHGDIGLQEAIIRESIKAPASCREKKEWEKLEIGLARDGFSLEEVEGDGYGDSTIKLRRVYPEIGGIDFPEAESEVFQLLSQFGFDVSKKHLELAINNFTQGAWPAANGEIRKVIVSVLDEIAKRLDPETYATKNKEEERRQILVSGDTPFLLTDLNEWIHGEKSDFVHGLINRLSPQGGHKGLSNEDDASFRLHIVLITARLFLRRYRKLTMMEKII